MKKTLLLIILFAIIGCHSEEITKSRCFYMGFTFTQQALMSNNAFENSDIINYHFDDVPWENILADDSIPPHITSMWDLRKSLTPMRHKIYVSVSPLSVNRDKMANDNSSSEKILPGFDSLPFTDDKVKIGYLKYCQQIINCFKPDFFNMSAEANLLYMLKPNLWSDFLEFQEYIYKQLKLSYPEVLIFSSVAAEPAIEDFVPKVDYLLQKLAILQILENSDIFSLSIHPTLLSSIPSSKAKNAFSELFNMNKKPFALAIINYPYLVFSPQPEISTFYEMDYHACLETILTACLNREAVFVINSIHIKQRIDDERTINDFNFLNSEMITAVWRKFLSADFNQNFSALKNQNPSATEN